MKLLLLRDANGTGMFVAHEDARAIDNMLEARAPVSVIAEGWDGCGVHEPGYAPLLRCGMPLPCPLHGDGGC